MPELVRAEKLKDPKLTDEQAEDNVIDNAENAGAEIPPEAKAKLKGKDGGAQGGTSITDALASAAPALQTAASIVGSLFGGGGGKGADQTQLWQEFTKQGTILTKAVTTLEDIRDYAKTIIGEMQKSIKESATPALSDSSEAPPETDALIRGEFSEPEIDAFIRGDLDPSKLQVATPSEAVTLDDRQPESPITPEAKPQPLLEPTVSESSSAAPGQNNQADQNGQQAGQTKDVQEMNVSATSLYINGNVEITTQGKILTA